MGMSLRGRSWLPGHGTRAPAGVVDGAGSPSSGERGLALDLELGGRVAFVTGASKGIGRAVAEQLAHEGADVVITARNAEPLEATAKELATATGRNVIPMAGDMSVTADVQRCVDATLARFGKIDILVTCAGSSPGGLLEDLTEDQWMASLNLKFMGYVRSVRAVIGHMRQRGEGSIVLVVGNDGLKPSYWEMTAGVANAADINFASSVAEQYGRYGVRINTVNPGPVNTDRWDTLEKAFARDKGVSQDRAHELANQSIPFGRICEPGEVAALVTFLASPRASFINGAHIPIDGAQRKAIMDQ
jgi:NAD(P)-dependent dehydrogenase (short-subunit alcohol dehydrogenase family)